MDTIKIITPLCFRCFLKIVVLLSCMIKVTEGSLYKISENGLNYDKAKNTNLRKINCKAKIENNLYVVLLTLIKPPFTRRTIVVTLLSIICNTLLPIRIAYFYQEARML